MLLLFFIIASCNNSGKKNNESSKGKTISIEQKNAMRIDSLNSILIIKQKEIDTLNTLLIQKKHLNQLLKNNNQQKFNRKELVNEINELRKGSNSLSRKLLEYNLKQDSIDKGYSLQLEADKKRIKNLEKENIYNTETLNKKNDSVIKIIFQKDANVLFLKKSRDSLVEIKNIMMHEKAKLEKMNFMYRQRIDTLEKFNSTKGKLLSNNNVELNDNKKRLLQLKKEKEIVSKELYEKRERYDSVLHQIDMKTIDIQGLKENNRELKTQLKSAKENVLHYKKNQILLHYRVDSLKRLIQESQINFKKSTNTEIKEKLTNIDSIKRSLLLTNEKIDKLSILLEGKDNIIKVKNKLISERTNQYYEEKKENDSIMLDLILIKQQRDSLLNTHSNNDTTILKKKDDLLIEDIAENKGLKYYHINNLRAKVKLKNKEIFNTFAENYINKYFKRRTSAKFLEINENFYFYVDSKGHVNKIEDQRTELNNNTKIFKLKELEELKQLVFIPVKIKGKPANVIVSIGIKISIDRTNYEYKIKKGKIRVYKTPMYVEYVESDNSHYKIINDAIKSYKGITSDFNIAIEDGVYSLNEYSRKEYNPFYKIKNTIIENRVIKVSKVRGIR